MNMSCTFCPELADVSKYLQDGTRVSGVRITNGLVGRTQFRGLRPMRGPLPP